MNHHTYLLVDRHSDIPPVLEQLEVNCTVDFTCGMKEKNETRFLLMWKSFLLLPHTVQPQALQEVISCCCFHFAFSGWMFYSFPGMLIKLMKGGMGIELIMFYGSKTQWGLRVFAPVFFSQLAEWLTLPGGCWAPAADGDRYEAEAPMRVLFIVVGAISLIPHSLLNISIIICIVSSLFLPLFNQNTLWLIRFPTEALDYIKVAVLLHALNSLMSWCCGLINVTWHAFCMHADILFLSCCLKIAWSLTLEGSIP